MTKQSILPSVGFDMSPVDSSTRVGLPHPHPHPHQPYFCQFVCEVNVFWCFQVGTRYQKCYKEHKRACFLCANSRMLCWAEFLFQPGIEMMIEGRAQGFLFGSSRLTSELGEPPLLLTSTFKKEETNSIQIIFPRSSKKYYHIHHMPKILHLFQEAHKVSYCGNIFSDQLWWGISGLACNYLCYCCPFPNFLTLSLSLSLSFCWHIMLGL